MNLTSTVDELHGIGKEAAKKFKSLGISNIDELIDYIPRRYEDYSNIVSIAKVRPGPVSIEATINNVVGRYVRRGMHITEAVASDSSGSVRLIWFNQPYRLSSIRPTQKYYISGHFELSHGRLSIMSPTIEAVSDFQVNTARIIPIYGETKGLTSRQIRAAISQTLPLIDDLDESLPEWLVAEQALLSRSQAYRAVHFPNSPAELIKARHRLGFEEIFQLTLASLLNKIANQSQHAPPISYELKLAKKFIGHLPFELTDAQRKVVWQIYQDLDDQRPMNRMIEGDVGSGKTVVATMAALMAIKRGWQVALMAPTEILAYQHLKTIQNLLRPLGMVDTVDILVGSLTTSQKSSTRQQIATGLTKFIVGTQALIQEKVDMNKLALIIVDEQHRFGVKQRKTLMAKAGHMPHVLSLSATPIPRSLALTLYGELDISVLDEKPAGRMPIITHLISPNSKQSMLQNIEQQLSLGRQMFVVCPLITDSSSLDLSSVEATYKKYKTHEFKNWRIGMLHGKMSAADKQSILQSFVDHELDVLVSTTVIEVGVDIPNASIMLIESPERFGLAQIHQLRGRVGRGAYQGYCYLLQSDSIAPSRRLRALVNTSDGFKLAELDLDIRGPGAIYGLSQHGQLDLRVASLSDTQLIASARLSAQQFIDKGEDLIHYKHLKNNVVKLQAVTNLN